MASTIMPDENIDPTEAAGDLNLMRDQVKSERPLDNSSSTPSIPLRAFIDGIPSIVAKYISLPRGDDGTGPLAKPILDLFGRVELPPEEWNRYALLNPSKNYTRNLVATDRTTYTLLVMVWTPGRSSPIHDHPCDGCWVRVLSGSIREYRYAPVAYPKDSVVPNPDQQDNEDEPLECVSDNVCREGQVLHIENWLGYHKVENPSMTEPAVTMHLYSPPFDRCRVWHDDGHVASSKSSWVLGFDSEYGTPC